MDFKEFLDAFINYNKRIYKKLILISIFVYYFTFLIFYNQFRVHLSQSEELSWVLGSIFALITTLILVFIVDILRVLFRLRSDREF